MLRILLSTLLLCVVTSTQFNLYETHRTDDLDRLQFDCLNYEKNEKLFLLISSRMTMIQYCLRPIDENNSMTDNSVNMRDQNFTFDELRRLNVTPQELISWSATVDLAESYQYYLDQKDILSVSTEVFFNCTQPWFGSRCQYSFKSGGTISLSAVVVMSFFSKPDHPAPYTVTNLTCYVHLRCDRGGLFMCLDWREVCDGRIDCLDGGADEENCIDLEMNECNENEYRCHNGLCIPQESEKSDLFSAYCLDRSDSHAFNTDGYSCITENSFDCEEHSCRPGSNEFSCGDGQCVKDFVSSSFDMCRNGRSVLSVKSMIAKGNLSHDCWMTMVCLTKITDSVGGLTCDEFFSSYDLIGSLETCESLIQFPTLPVLFGHVRLLYQKNNIQDLDTNFALAPDYVCYDEQLCDFLTPTFRNGNDTCQAGFDLGFGPNGEHHNWEEIIDTIKPYFRGCLTEYKKENDSEHPPSLYCCKNSSKCISKHRILDGISDCYLNDDEDQFELSCSINDTHRFKCPDEEKCFSPLISRDICPSINERHLTFDEILFQEICDRIVHILPVMINERNHTDETECESWSCNNIYTRCDLFWNCPSGEDEENCTQSICSSRLHACVSPYDYKLICLSADRIDDGINDCLAASDELHYCPAMDSSDERRRFRCFNDTKCVATYQLCNSEEDCPFGDDEAFCESDRILCDNNDQFANQKDVMDVICQLEHRNKLFFTLESSIANSFANELINHNAEWSTDLEITDEDDDDDDDDSWVWRCNRGLYARVWSEANNHSYKCFCPPSYYGDRCQYQNQRVSLILRLTAVDHRGIYVIFVTLIDDDEDRREINSYEQFDYIPRRSCMSIFNIYLLYSTRPKNSSKNYTVHVDAFDKTSLTYIASWYFPIPFLFLPVNQLVVQLTVPAQRAPHPNHCPITCYSGQCVKYTIVEKFFCQCLPGWGGAQCQNRINCADCSSDSICLGSIRNRSICVCSLNKYGPRCLLRRSCPPNACENNGQCIVIDGRMAVDFYYCICSEQFFGQNCEDSKKKLEISLNNMEIPSYLIAFTFVVSDNSPPSREVTLQKLSMFQQTVTLYKEESWHFDMLFVKIDSSYYLTFPQQSEQSDILTSISPVQRCVSIDETLNSTLLALPRIRRVKYYHIPCRIQPDLLCFFDELYMCLCTSEHYANCFQFDYNANLECQHNLHCQNGAQCLQDHPTCPSKTICVCSDCFFGDQCQFYVKGIGLTLDDILRYEIRPNTLLADQPLSVKMSTTLIMIMFVGGIVNSFLSLLVFQRKDSRKVGCGMYLFASSITSLLAISMLTLKFWFLILTQINVSVNRTILRGGCMSIEPVLKLLLYLDNWFNACVAVERAITVSKGANFDATKSKHIAQWVIFLLPVFIMGSIIHEPLYRELFDDKEEQRIWCVTRYPHSIQSYNTAILFFHFLAPFSANLFSALFIIFSLARQRAVIRTRQSYKQHLCEQLNEHKQLVISPLILVVLLVPRLIISLLSDCVKASRDPWLYLSGYFISFIPSVLVFAVFVLPSKLYKKQFKESVRSLRRRFNQD